jgi:hypothetical protein
MEPRKSANRWLLSAVLLAIIALMGLVSMTQLRAAQEASASDQAFGETGRAVYATNTQWAIISRLSPEPCSCWTITPSPTVTPTKTLRPTYTPRP